MSKFEVVHAELGDGAKFEQFWSCSEIVDPVLPKQPVNEAFNDENIQDAPIQDPVMPNSPREGVVEDTSDSESTESEDNDPDVSRISVDRPTTSTTQVSVSVSTPPGPTVTSTQVTPNTKRLLDELIHTPSVGTSSSPSVTIPVSPSIVSPSRSRRTTRSTSTLRDENDDNTNMVSTICDLKARLISLEHGQLQIESLTASLENALKQLATQGESSYRQETLIIPEDDDVDTEGAQGNKGDDQQGKENVEENVEENVDKETLECLIDLDSVIVDDWDSDAEDVEIEFEQHNEVIKYATHEGVEFDTLFIDEIN
ncbi:hypothetical protein L1987_09062 [Smallanthus sonchifolius]|uniref:Uncharacterized protein n=1 Tax=Smallanthus sonchifolius TaxID=185202 RepID=A0ACB9JMV5_9ASTR|nr:hypothetical protein L1987_09062 [Smallanthus sonchifolius]